MLRFWLRLVLSGSLAVSTAGCIARTLPIPPPGATASGENCSAETCPDGGVIVVITGNAEAGSLVVARNNSRMLADGSVYGASAWTTQFASDGGVGDAGPNGLGTYRIRLEPQPNPAASPTISQHGDVISVSQFVQSQDGSWQESLNVEITVP